MTMNANEVRVAITGKVLTAPLGTVLPVDVATVMPIAWHDHGYTTPDGVIIGSAITKYDVFAWQSGSPVRSIKVRNEHTLKFTLIQSGASNTVLAFGGGTWTVAALVYTYTPPVSGTSDDRAVVIEYTDGAVTKRWCFTRATISSVGDVVLKAGEEVRYEVTLMVLSDSWNIVSNDPADAPAGGGGGGADDAPLTGRKAA